MDDKEEIGTEQDLMQSISEGLAKSFGAPEGAAKKAKRESLEEMTKALPDWSLEPPETFLP